jgi:DNA-binding phage protein
MTLDTSYHERRLAQLMEDPEFKANYERAQAQIKQVDEVMRALDQLRVESHMSKAELARRIGKNPASVRRLFSSEANPELGTIAAMATALDAEITIKPRRNKRQPGRPTARQMLPA